MLPLWSRHFLSRIKKKQVVLVIIQIATRIEVKYLPIDSPNLGFRVGELSDELNEKNRIIDDLNRQIREMKQSMHETLTYDEAEEVPHFFILCSMFRFPLISEF